MRRGGFGLLLAVVILVAPRMSMAQLFSATQDPVAGERLFSAKGCVSCHAVNGKGGTVAADFAKSTVIGSPASVIAGMWNHGPLMETAAQKQSVSWPMLKGRDLADIAAYFNSLNKRPASSATSK